MDTTLIVFLLTDFICFISGFGLAYWLRGTQAKDGRLLAEQLIRQSEIQRKTYEAQLVDAVRGKFSEVSMEVLKRSQDNFMTLAQERFGRESTQHTKELDSKKQLIDQQLDTMNVKLGEVTRLVNGFEEKSAERLGSLGTQLQQLNQTSSLLQKALADNRARGQWGERIAEDILKMLGFVEGINYVKQATVNGSADHKIRPDFTFRLPNGMTLNMDSKFPLDNYLLCLNAGSPTESETYKRKFLADLRGHVKAVSSKDYVNSLQGTIDCVLIFIPNEQIYRFVHESDVKLIDDALKQKVILCSPLTLFVVLAVIRQAIDNFKLEQSSLEILKLLNQFKEQWGKYVKRMDDIGTALDKARTVYTDVVGTRQNALEKPMTRIDGLMHDYGLDCEKVETEIATMVPQSPAQ